MPKFTNDELLSKTATKKVEIETTTTVAQTYTNVIPKVPDGYELTGEFRMLKDGEECLGCDGIIWSQQSVKGPRLIVKKRAPRVRYILEELDETGFASHEKAVVFQSDCGCFKALRGVCNSGTTGPLFSVTKEQF